MSNAAMLEGRCRYWLRRDVADTMISAMLAQAPLTRRAVVVMHNPSKADADHDDPTVRALLDFCRVWRVRELTVGNINPVICTNPNLLPFPTDAEVLANAAIVQSMAKGCDLIVCGWGAIKPRYFGQAAAFCSYFVKLGIPLHRIGSPTKDGHPRHPLYTARATPLEPYAPVDDSPAYFYKREASGH